MPIAADGPSQQVLDRIWTLLEASQRLADLVPPAGRIRFADAETPDPADLSAEAAPRLTVEPAGFARTETEGDVSYVQTYRFVLIAADRRTAPVQRLKFLIAAALERAGPTLGLDLVAGWDVPDAAEEPDSSDLTRRVNPVRGGDRRDAAGGRRVVMRLRVRLRPGAAELAAWLGSSTDPPAVRHRAVIAGLDLGAGLLGMRVTAEPAGRMIVELRAVAAESDRFALEDRLAPLRRLIGRPGVTVEIREADGGRPAAWMPAAVLERLDPPDGPPAPGRAVITAAVSSPTEPLWRTGTTEVRSAAAASAGADAGVAWSAGHAISAEGHVASSARPALEWTA
jgi:hypothetical protein